MKICLHFILNFVQILLFSNILKITDLEDNGLRFKLTPGRYLADTEGWISPTSGYND